MPDQAGSQPPPPSSSRAAGTRPQPAWWQHWQVVVLFVVAAFASGAVAGLVTWMALEDDGDGSQLTDGGSETGITNDRSARLGDTAPKSAASPLPEAELSVASDGCGVIRSDIGVEPHGLQWSVLDNEGFEVLGRNALGETRYRYFRPGTYTVVLKAWDGEKYVSISNTVTITC